MAGIFISYRRSDSAAMCDRIYAALVQHFGKGAIFKDIDNIPLGVNFADYIRSVMAQSAVALVVIGRTWLDVTDEQGRRRLDNPDDFVRQEIEEALARNIPVIPLRVDGAAMPRAEQLPPSLHGLLVQNGWEVHYDPYFETDMRHVKAGLEGWLRSMQARQQAELQAEYARQQEAARQAAMAAEAARQREYARQQELGRKAAFAASRTPLVPLTFEPGYATVAPVSYPLAPYAAQSRPKSTVPWRRALLLYGVGFGVAAAAIATLTNYLVSPYGLNLQVVGAASVVLYSINGIALLLVGAVSSFLVRYRYPSFAAGLLAALLAGLFTWLGYTSVTFIIVSPSTQTSTQSASLALTPQEMAGVTVFAGFMLTILMAGFGALFGTLAGLLGGWGAMLWLRMRPKRSNDSGGARSAVVNSQAMTRPPVMP